jgi:hypothetical protein
MNNKWQDTSKFLQANIIIEGRREKRWKREKKIHQSSIIVSFFTRVKLLEKSWCDTSNSDMKVVIGCLVMPLALPEDSGSPLLAGSWGTYTNLFTLLVYPNLYIYLVLILVL